LASFSPHIFMVHFKRSTGDTMITGILYGLGSSWEPMVGRPEDMRALSEKELDDMAREIAPLLANAKLSTAQILAMANYRPVWQGPPAPQGWADWFEFGDDAC
jgi:hypothetical protein